MHNLDWNDVQYFLEVVRGGSVSQAAQRLGVNQTTVSRRITTLENHLGKNLFDRSGHSWVITPVGEKIIQAAETMADEIHSIERHVMADSQELSGRLCVTVADVCTQYLVMPAVTAFSQRYPNVDLEIIATRNTLDLGAREADVALRSTDEPPANLIGKRVAQLAYAIYGSHDLAQRMAAEPDKLPCITWIGDGHTRPPWIEKSFPKTPSVYRSNELGVMLQMVKCGLGVAQLPCVLGDLDPQLQRIPARYVEPGWGLWVLSHVDLRTTARVRLFKDILVEELEMRKDLIEGRLQKS